MSTAQSTALSAGLATPNEHAHPEISGAEIIVRCLERQGVEIVAGIPGGALLPLYEALGRSVRIRHILARHEQAAGFIAQGIARMTHRAGVCLATSGPGVTNMLTALADAKMDSIPLVCITGQVPMHLIGTDAFQEVATIKLAKPITKAAFMARSADELAELMAEAFHIAESGRPGPVLIDVPKDVQLQRCSMPSSLAKREASRPAKCSESFDAATAMIDAAQKPLLYIGGGVVKARASRELQRLAEDASIPVTTTLMAMGALPHDHPLNLGMLGMHGAMSTHHALEECDLLIAIGARFDDRATGDPTRFAPDAKIVHIDIDPREFGKIKAPRLAIHCDAWLALATLLSRIKHIQRTEWIERISELRARYSIKPLRVLTPETESIANDPVHFIRSIGNALPDDAVLTTDVGQHQMWVAQAYPFTQANRWLTSGGLGTMGFGLSAAIGAALAEPSATVACFTGDGSLLMNIQELATLAELNLNVKIILLDNASLGMVRQQQHMFYRRLYSASEFHRPSDFIRIAEAFGIQSIDLSSHDNEDALQAALQSLGPMLIRLSIDSNHKVLPMVPSGQANIEAVEEA
jgi:acetolactate synthase-1/2/3 large subunit